MGTVKSDIWVNQDIYLWFRQDDEEPRGMFGAGLSDVYIGQALGSTWECSYCGSTMPASSLKCDACNAPRKTRKRRATAQLVGLLPELVWFDAARDGFTLEARRCRYDPTYYDGGEAVARLAKCKIIEKRVPRLVWNGPEEEIEALRLYAEIEGDFSFADMEYEDEQNPNR